MSKMPKIEGIVPVLVTPLTKEGDIDEVGLEKLLEFLLTKTTAGFWALGTGSEDMNLTYAKRLKLARLVTEIVDKRAPVMMGGSFFALEDTMNFIDDIKDMAFDAYHWMPYHPLFSLDSLERHYRILADYAPKPLWMYTSANWCRMIPPEFVDRLVDHPNIAGVKYSTSNNWHIGHVIALQNENFQVIPAVVKTLYSCLAQGAKAFTTSEASCLPEPVIEIYDLFQAGKLDEALAAQRNLCAFLREFPHGPSTDNFLKSVEEKTILQIRGICNNYTTAYCRDATEEEVEAMKACLKKWKMPPFAEAKADLVHA